MHISSAVLLIAVLAALAEGCPFASSSGEMPKNHPPLKRDLARRMLQEEESLIGLDGRLVGSPSLDNGAVSLPSLLTERDGVSIADMVAELSTNGGNGDMCLIRFQQLPPPEVGGFSFDQNEADRLNLKLYGDQMVQRFYDLTGPDINEGGIILSIATIGQGGVESMCNAGIEPERFCDERLLNQSLRWPQAITGYKLTSETVDAVKQAILTWRTTDEGHLPSMSWSFNGGNVEAGGSEVGYWGNKGGLFSKIVKCDDIPEEFMYFKYPNDTATSDFILPETNTTLNEIIYKWWLAYGGYDENGEQVFGEAPSLPEECGFCVEAIPCFDWNGCSSLDFETLTWAAPYEECNAAAACVSCFPDCSPAIGDEQETAAPEPGDEQDTTAPEPGDGGGETADSGAFAMSFATICVVTAGCMLL